MRSTLALSLVLIVSSVTFGASPRTRSIRPAGGQRGTEVEVTISGRRLGDAKEVLFYHPGIEATNIKVVNDAEIKATFKIAADSPLGLHDLRLRTATGLSEMRSFSVGVLKDVAEVEPNSDFAKPQPITLGSTINGVADNEDVDYFVVEAKKGERIAAEVEGIRLGATFFDPYVAILDTKRFELAVSDDASMVWQDAFASIVAPEDGSYIILVRDSAYAGNSQCVYRLHVGNFPRPAAVVPAGGKVGETVGLRWVGDVLGEMPSSVALPARAETGFGLYAQDERGIAPYPNLFRLSSFGNVMEAEPNNEAATATPFTAPLACNGVIDRPGDVDQFVFTAKKGDRYEVKVFARTLRSPLDAILSITQRKGGAIGRNDDANGSPDSALPFTAPADGEYVIAIQDQLLNGGPDYFYRIEVAPVEPLLTLSVPNESLYQRRNQPIVVPVPKGGLQAILVNATRTGFSGELAIEAQGLPAGVTVEADSMAAGLGTYPVLFHAAADAPMAGALASFTGKPTDPKVNVPCVFQHANEMVTGQNNAPFWTRTEDRFAVAVTEEAPFSIEVVEPKVPLVRSGSMDLKVVAHRKPGFKTPIAVALLWNPPGIGSSGSVTIPEGQDEALIPLNASDGAELKTWRTTVVGTAEVANPIEDSGPPPPPRPGGNRGQDRLGTVSVASPLCRIAVAEKFVSFELQAATVEQGNETDLVVKVTKLADFAGEAQVTLLGLPNKVTAEPKTITKDTDELVFHLKTDKVSPAGNHPNLVCRAVILKDGEPMVHNLGPGRLRIDVPLPAKPSAPAANKPETAPVAAATAKPPAAAAKPVSRLEQLRRERQQAAQAQQQAQVVEMKSERGLVIGPETRRTLPVFDSPTTRKRTRTVMTPLYVARNLAAAVAVLGLAGPVLAQKAEITRLDVFPPAVNLTGGGDRQAVVVQAVYANGITRDVTAEATQSLARPEVVRRDAATYFPTADGETTLAVSFGGRSATVPVKVAGAAEPATISFRLDVMPVFMRSGCNTGSCHGAARGKDGFRLSLFGFDPEGDHFRLTHEMSGRRINLAVPADSTVLEKSTGTVQHTGGKRFEADSESYRTLARWIEAGAPNDEVAKLPTVTGVDLYPKQAVLDGKGSAQQYTALAHYSDGTDRDVTRLCVFLSNNDTSAAITPDGLVTAGDRGEAFVMARFSTYTVGSQVLVLPKGLEFQYPEEPEVNYIDHLVAAKLNKLRIAPSGLCDDETYIRRVFLDIVGLPPTVEEFQQFMSSTDPEKRARLIDELLERKEFSEIWVNKWAEILQVRSSNQVSVKSMVLYYSWLVDKVAKNTPMDQMVRELLGASGGTFKNAATNYYQEVRQNLLLSENVAQVFMGMRIQFAQCHNHPFDRWTQNDYYGFAAFFAQIGRKRGEDYRETIVFNSGGGEVRHPISKDVMKPKFLGGDVPDVTGKDRRVVLAEWLASPQNPWFATSFANRVWAHFMGLGIVEPVDDFRVSNPASNPELLAALGQRFTDSKYDLKTLVRDICNSRTYQRATQRNESNTSDERNFAHANLRRIKAESLLDAISAVTNTKDKFQGLPMGARAVQIADGQRSTYFLRTFGRATRETVCSCEVKMEPTLSQALHLLNGDTTNTKIGASDVIPTLMKTRKFPEERIIELYIRTLSRRPTDEELDKLRPVVGEGSNQKQALEDIFWALLNSREFLFNH